MDTFRRNRRRYPYL